MDAVRIRKLEEREALLRETLEDALCSLERNSEITVEHLKMLRGLASVWRAARELVECEKRAHGVAAPIKLKE